MIIEKCEYCKKVKETFNLKLWIPDRQRPVCPDCLTKIINSSDKEKDKIRAKIIKTK